MSEKRIAEILKAFEFYDKEYKRDEVDAAVELQEEITPHLIAVLESILANPSEYASNPAYFTHMYAVVLLAYFEEQAAHRVIIDLFSLPGEIPDQLFGDMTTETLPTLLIKTCGEKLDLIKSFALNKEANEYCRGSALRAMVLAVADGMIAREEALTFFAPLFTGNQAEPDSSFWSMLASCVNDLYPEELMDVIKQAYEDELILPFFIGYKEFLRTLKVGKEKTLMQLPNKLRLYRQDNVHDYLSSWACFKQDKPSAYDLALLAAAASKKESKKRSSSRKKTPSSKESSPKKASKKQAPIPNISKIAKRKKKKSRASRKKKRKR